jgi:hypothetical protein
MQKNYNYIGFQENKTYFIRKLVKIAENYDRNFDFDLGSI